MKRFTKKQIAYARLFSEILATCSDKEKEQFRNFLQSGDDFDAAEAAFSEAYDRFYALPMGAKIRKWLDSK